MMIGDLLALAQRSSFAFVAWIEKEDPQLAERCRKAADGRDFDRWLRECVTWFELHASSDDWADLTSRIRGSETPGQALLTAMVERWLREQASHE